MSFIGRALNFVAKPTRVLMAVLKSITHGLDIRFGVDATEVVSVHDWKNNCHERSFHGWKYGTNRK
jgi:hypothetical protein